MKDELLESLDWYASRPYYKGPDGIAAEEAATTIRAYRARLRIIQGIIALGAKLDIPAKALVEQVKVLGLWEEDDEQD